MKLKRNYRVEDDIQKVTLLDNAGYLSSSITCWLQTAKTTVAERMFNCSPLMSVRSSPVGLNFNATYKMQHWREAETNPYSCICHPEKTISNIQQHHPTTTPRAPRAGPRISRCSLRPGYTLCNVNVSFRVGAAYRSTCVRGTLRRGEPYLCAG